MLKARGAAVRREQFTEIDRELLRRGGAKHVVRFDGRQPRGTAARERRAQEMARLKFLDRVGLARKIDSACWRLAPNLERTLRERQLVIDIIRSRARQQRHMLDKRAPLAVTKLAPGQELTGRVVGTGLGNEARDSRYVMLEGTDGKLHYLRQTPAIIRARGEGRIGIGELVTLEAREFEKDGHSVNYIRVEQHGQLLSIRRTSRSVTGSTSKRSRLSSATGGSAGAGGRDSPANGGSRWKTVCRLGAGRTNRPPLFNHPPLLRAARRPTEASRGDCRARTPRAAATTPKGAYTLMAAALRRLRP